MKHTILIVILSILFSCSNENVRVQMIEDNLQIELPQNYEVIENNFEGLIDFEINMKLKFDKKGLRFVEKQIHKTKYYEWADINILAKYPKKLTVVNQDTMIKGRWINIKKGYRFNYIGDWTESVFAEIDTLKKELNFKFVHL